MCHVERRKCIHKQHASVCVCARCRIDVFTDPTWMVRLNVYLHRAVFACYAVCVRIVYSSRTSSSCMCVTCTVIHRVDCCYCIRRTNIIRIKKWFISIWMRFREYTNGVISNIVSYLVLLLSFSPPDLFSSLCVGNPNHSKQMKWVENHWNPCTDVWNSDD